MKGFSPVRQEAQAPADLRGQALLSVLLVEDNPGDAALVRAMLDESGEAFELAVRDTLDAALTLLAGEHVEVILLDLGLPDSQGLDSIARVLAAAPAAPLIVITGQESDELPVLAVQAHAQEFLVKGEFGSEVLLRTVRQAIERKRQQRELAALADALRESVDHFQRLIATSADGLVVLGDSGDVLFANPAAEGLLGSSPDDLLRDVVQRPLEDGARLELWLGEDRVAELRLASIRWRNEPAFLATVRDVTERKAAEVELRRQNNRLQVTNTRLSRLAYVDPLTELLNRRGLERVLEAEISRSRRSASALSACLVDCDDFKLVNDHLGHPAGDALLKEIAARLRASLRPSDHLARVGGDEFLVVLPETRLPEAVHVARRLREAVSEVLLPAPLPTGARRSTVSIGVAAVPRQTSSVEEMLAVTEAALQHSKRRGKDRVTSLDEDEREEPDSDALSRLLAPDGLRAVVQSIRDLRDERVVGWELCARGPEGTLEAPRSIFALGSSRRELARLDLRALEVCLAAAERLPADGSPRLHVNLFPGTLLEVPPSRLLELLRPDRRPRALCIEISEQELAGDVSALREPLQELAAAGVDLALDGVGFGRSSLEALLLLEPDLVKIDPQLCRGCAEDPARARALRRMVQVAAAAGARTVAEAVETRPDLDLLRDLAVDEGQGHLWDRPRPLE